MCRVAFSKRKPLNALALSGGRGTQTLARDVSNALNVEGSMNEGMPRVEVNPSKAHEPDKVFTMSSGASEQRCPRCDVLLGEIKNTLGVIRTIEADNKRLQEELHYRYD